MAAAASGDTGLVVVDFQNEYFASAGGQIPVPNIDEVAGRGAEILASFREKGRPIVHMRHTAKDSNGLFEDGRPGSVINESVQPLDGEPVMEKHRPDSFHNTKLEKFLRDAGVKNLVVVGAMTHMCINDTARSAMNLGFATAVVDDATASMDVARGDSKVEGKAMHDAAISQLEWIGCTITNTADVVSDKVAFKEAPAHDWVSE